jgi:DNA polymerase III delta prime subunit
MNEISITKAKKVFKKIAETEKLEIPEEVMTSVYEDSDGDLRNCVNSLQFLLLGQERVVLAPKKRKKKDPSSIKQHSIDSK